MVVPRVVVEPKQKVGTPTGDLSLRLHLVMSSSSSSAALSLVSLWVGFHTGEWRLASVTTIVVSSCVVSGRFFISVSQAAKPENSFGVL